jgi:hypothetical protein
VVSQEKLPEELSKEDPAGASDVDTCTGRSSESEALTAKSITSPTVTLVDSGATMDMVNLRTTITNCWELLPILAVICTVAEAFTLPTPSKSADF